MWAHTTATHQEHFLPRASEGKPVHYNKAQHRAAPMNNVRIVQLNKIATRAALERGIKVIDMYTPTVARKTDPMSRGDTRHYGRTTVMFYKFAFWHRISCGPRVESI